MIPGDRRRILIPKIVTMYGTDLEYPRPGEKFITTNEINVRIRGVLLQIQDGQKRVVAYYSKTLCRAQKKCCVTRRELLEILKYHTSTKNSKEKTCAPTTPP